MKKEKISNVKVSKGIKKLIGTMVLVDSLIIGIVSLGGHTPIYQDDKKIPEVIETVYTDYQDNHEVEVTNYYQNEIDAKKKVIYYKKPFTTEEGKFREIVTVYNNNFGPTRETKIVRISPATPDDDTYIETYEYDINTNKYITVKETLHDEIAYDILLLFVTGIIDVGMYAAGMSYLRREEEEDNKTI